MALTSENGELKAKKAKLFPPFPPDLIAVVKSVVDNGNDDEDGKTGGGKVWKQRAISEQGRKWKGKANRERR